MQLRFLPLPFIFSSLVFNTNAQNTFPASGNVGIGTTTPQQRLHVEGTSNQAIFVNTSALSTTSGSGMIGYVKALPTAAGQRLGYFLLGSRGGAQNNYNVAGMVGYAGGAWSGSSRPAYLSFETTPSGSTARVERLRIAADGHVGIGTPDPLQPLHVVGNGVFSGNMGLGTSSPQYPLDVQRSSAVARLKGTNGYASLILDKTTSIREATVHYQTDGVGKWSHGTLSDNHFRLRNETLGSIALSVNGDNNNVGIGNTSPGKKLVVTASNAVNDAAALIQNLTTNSIVKDGLYIQAGHDGGGNSWYAAFQKPNGAFIGAIRQTSATSVTYNTSSDKRLKTNIRETRFGLAEVNKIQVKDYSFIGSKEEQTGFLAQQLYEVFPEAVGKGGDNPKERPWMVDYGRLTPLLVKAVQELSKKTDEIEELRKENTEIKQQLAELKALVLGKNNGAALLEAGAYLEQNIPNPSPGTTTVRYRIPDATTSARLTLVNSKGQVMQEVNLTARGTGQVNLSTTSLPAGVYTYSLWVNGQQAASKQLVVAK